MGKLIILRGNSGSGKTTVARALQRKFGRNTLFLSQDTVRREMLWAHDGYGADGGMKRTTSTLFLKRRSQKKCLSRKRLK